MLTYSPTSPIGSRPYVTRVKPLPTSYKRNNNRRPQKDQTPLICITLFSLRGLKSLLILVIVSEFEKRDNFAPFPKFGFKTLKSLWNHSSYELQIWHEHFFIILLH